MGRRRRRGSQQARSPKAVWFGAGAFAVLGLAVLLAVLPLRRQGSPSVPPPGAPALGAQVVVVGMAGFSPARLQARAGEDVRLTFINPDSRFHTDGGGWHQFRIEALDIDVKIPPSSQRTVVLRNLQTGTYEFYCDVCCGGKQNPAMRGVFKVTG